jgi:hypothetical protein
MRSVGGLRAHPHMATPGGRRVGSVVHLRGRRRTRRPFLSGMLTRHGTTGQASHASQPLSR